jgi:hypothetical protein
MKSHRRQRLVRAALAGRHRHRVARIRPGVPPGTLVTAEAAERPALETITFSADGVAGGRAAPPDPPPGSAGAPTPSTPRWIGRRPAP